LYAVNNGILKQGSPSQPVRIIGFKNLPKAGDPIICVESEEAAEELVEQRAALEAANGVDRPKVVKEVEIQIPGMRSRDTVRSKRVYDKAGFTQEDGTIRIPVIIKADADGSLSAIRESLIKIGTLSKHKVLIDPVAEGIGVITASDIQMAKESDATIFAFGMKRIDQTTMNLAENEEVVIRSNDIIYSLLDEAKEIFGGYLPKVPFEHIHGKASIQAIFQIGSDNGEEKVAGLRVLDGHMYKEKAPLNSGHIKCHFRVLRDGKQISPEGKAISASSLRRHKELVDSVRRGEECGLGLAGFYDFKEGDVIECYSVEMKNSSI
jgi:translation initiation factor IF-2